MFRPLAEKKNIDLRMHVDPDMPPVQQDPEQVAADPLEPAVQRDQVHAGGRPGIAPGRADGSDFVLVVSDTGVGIAPEDQEAVFDKFRQAANPMTREHEGTGLGLSIVRELAKLLGGDMTLKSELGRGSTFTVRLPQHLASEQKLLYLPPVGAFADGPDGGPASVSHAMGK